MNQNEMRCFSKRASQVAPATNKVTTREYTIDIHMCISGVGFKKHATQALKEIWRLAMKEMRTPDVCMDTRFNKAVQAKGMRKDNEDEDPPNKLYTLITYVPVSAFKNLPRVNVDENYY
ncbi:60S ribosomal protein L31-like [Canis lupus familiaris]|uniref:60S ribosomal protein L31-like n=1 Tax=Canis lupus familiaris TaxID=9615 RepID=UPI0018F7BA2C|nr:60S ribosomal protein L31-like [Canis lupus familiaris]XP_038540562.1 60S ribosomal protein L31-like [Canis lupus familiaris]